MTKTSRFTTKQLMLCALFTALITIGTFLKVPIPVLPFTLQFLFTNLAGLLLGRRLGAISVAVYIAIGLVGMPVFTQGGGIGYVFQPTFGYIIGFMAGAWLAGFIVEKSETPSFKRILAASFANLGIVYLFGMVYYYFVANYYTNSPIGIWSLFLYCFILAIPGDIVLCFISTILSKRLIPMVKKG